MNCKKIKENFVDPKIYTSDPTQEEPEFDDGKTKPSILRKYAESKYRIQAIGSPIQTPNCQSHSPPIPLQKRVTIIEYKDMTYGFIQSNKENEAVVVLNREQQGLRDAFSRYQQKLRQN